MTEQELQNRNLYWRLFGKPALYEVKLRRLREAYRIGYRLGKGCLVTKAGLLSGVQAAKAGGR